MVSANISLLFQISFLISDLKFCFHARLEQSHSLTFRNTKLRNLSMADEPLLLFTFQLA
jgi:hypothetical protein